MHRSSRIALPVLAALALFACTKKAASGGGDAKESTILIGEIGSLTGSEATFGASSDDGIRLAFEEANAQGGVKGKKLELKVLDDQGKPEEAATATTRLISSDHVTALLGEVASSRSLYMADKAQAAHLPMLTPSSTNPKVTKKGDYIFRACFTDTFQGHQLARFAAQNLKLKKVAVLRDVRSDYSVGLADSFSQSFTQLGGQVIDDESYSNGDFDFKAQLTNIKAKNPEAVVVPGYYTDVGLIAKQAREVGISVPLLGGDGWDSAKLYEIGGAALDGSYFTDHYSPDDPNPKVQDFVRKYQKMHPGQLPDAIAAMGYDGAGVLVDALKRAKDLTGPSIRDALAATKGFEGVTGNITMDAERNTVKPIVVLQVQKGGHYKLVAKIEPETAPAPAPQAAAAH